LIAATAKVHPPTQQNNPIRTHNSAGTVGNQDHRDSPVELFYRCNVFTLSIVVKRAGDFVEHQQACLLVEHSSAGRKSDGPSLTHNRSVSFGLLSISSALRAYEATWLTLWHSMSWLSSEAQLWVRCLVCVRFGGGAPN